MSNAIFLFLAVVFGRYFTKKHDTPEMLEELADKFQDKVSILETKETLGKKDYVPKHLRHEGLASTL